MSAASVPAPMSESPRPSPAAASSPLPGTAAPGPASPTRRVLAQASFDARTMLRNGEQLLLTVVLPLLALVGLALTSVPDLGEGRRIDLATPGVLALAVLSTAFTGQAIATGFDRRYGVLRLLGTTPLGRSGLLAGRVLAVLVVEAVQLVLIGGAGLALGWRPEVGGLFPALVAGLLGTAAFVALGLLLAGTLRAEGVLAVANLAWVLLAAAGGVVLSPDRMGPAGAAAEALPSGALGEALRAALVDGRFDAVALLVLLAWTVAAGAATARWFRWS